MGFRSNPRSSRKIYRGGALVSLCLLWALTACIDLPREEFEPRVTPEFNPDPANPAVPQPIDIPGLTKDPVSGMVTAPVPEDASLAYRELFEGYINTLDGWALNSTLTFAFTGTVDHETVHDGTVRVYAAQGRDGALVRSDIGFLIVTEDVAVDPAHPEGPSKTAVTLIPERALAPGVLYAVAVAGNTAGGILTTEGQPVTTPFAFTFLKSLEPLIRIFEDDDGREHVLSNIVLGAETPEDVEVLRLLEAMREGYAPLLETIADTDLMDEYALPLEQVVLFWTFTTQSDTIALFDPLTETIPAPNDLLFEGDRLSFPINPERDSPVQVRMFEWLNTLDGFSVLSEPVLGFSAALDADSISSDSVRVFEIDGDGQITEIDWVAPVYKPTGARVVLELLDARRHFAHGHTYVVAALSGGGEGGIEDSRGRPVLRSQAMALALLRAPLLTAEGESALPGVLDDDDAAEFEDVRAGYDTLLSALGEQFDIDRDGLASFWTFTTGTRAESLVNPNLGIIPSPNALILVPDLLEPLITAARRAGRKAEEEFLTWLGEQGGWSVVMAGDAQFSKPLDQDSFGEALHVLEMAVQTTKVDHVRFAQPLDPEERVTAIDFYPARSWKPGTRYLALVTDALRTVEGEPVEPSSFQVLIRGSEPVFAPGVGNQVPALLTDLDALQVEVVRLQSADALDRALDKLGIERERVIAHWAFETHNDNEVHFSPASFVLPFPNELMQSREMVPESSPPRPMPGILLPPAEEESGIVADTLEALRALDGFSVLTSATARLAKPLAPDSLRTADEVLDILDVGIALADITEIDVAPGSELELSDLMLIEPVEDTRAAFDPNTNTLSVGPPRGRPFLQNRRYMVALTDRLKSGDESPIRVSPPFWFARSPHPLATGTDPTSDQSLVGLLSNEDAAALEELRRAYEPMFLGFDMIGELSPRLHGRDSVVQFWTFWAQDITGPLERMIASLDEELPVEDIVIDQYAPIGREQHSPVIEYIFQEDEEASRFFADEDRGLILDLKIPSKTLLTEPDFRDSQNAICGPARPYDLEAGFDWRDDEIPVDIYVPEERIDDGVEKPYPVVLFAGGLGGSKHDVLRFGLADALMEAGFVVVAVELPLHGKRTCHHCVNSGEGFLCHDPVALRDNYVQAALDLHQVARAVRGGLLNSIVRGMGPKEVIDEDSLDEMGFVGTSIGSMVGTMFIATAPYIKHAVLNAPGGHFARFIEDNDAVWLQQYVREMLCGALGDTMPRLCEFNENSNDYLCYRPGMGCDPIPWSHPEIRELLATLQWLLDRADPVAYGPYLFAHSLFDIERRVLLQVAQNDELFKADVVTALRNSMAGGARGSADYEPYGGGACHAFLLHGCPEAANQETVEQSRERARGDIVEYLMSGALPY